MQRPLRQELDALAKRAEHARSTQETPWRDIIRFIMPGHGRLTHKDRARAEFEYDDSAILNPKGMHALRVLTSGLHSGMTSPSRNWFRLKHPDAQAMQDDGVRAYLAECEKRMRAVYASSNLYASFPMFYEEAAGFGTTVGLILDDDEHVVRFVPLTVGEYGILNGPDGEVDVLFREFRMSAANVMRDFDEDRVSARTKQLAMTNSAEQEVTIRHLLLPADYPLDALKTVKRTNPDHDWLSLYWEPGAQGDMLLRESGFFEKPFFAARWQMRPGDVYGIGPGHMALPDVIQLQSQAREKAMAIAKLVDPPTLVSAALKNSGGLGTLPGDETYVADVDQGARPVYQVAPRVQELMMDIQATEARIDRAFYADLFLMMSQSDRREITAREVDERSQEKLLMLGTAYQNLSRELLKPTVDRPFSIMQRRGLLPEPPEALEGVELEVEFSSILEDAQRRAELGGLHQLVEFVGMLAGLKGEDALDKIDADELIETANHMLGNAPGLVVDDEVAAKVRAARAKQMQQAAAMEQAAAAAQTAAAASGAVTSKEGDTLLTDMAGER